MTFSWLYSFAIHAATWAVPGVSAVVLHELAHGAVAFALGDDTAKRAGRLTLNPLRHIDLIGTLIVPFGLWTFTPYIFGWAKPVPIDLSRVKRLPPRQCMLLISLAGPVSNLLMAVAWSFAGNIFSGTLAHDSGIATHVIVSMCRAGVVMNLILAFFNLLPIPPCDGGYALTAFLPKKAAEYYAKLHYYGLVLLACLIITNVLHPYLYATTEFFWQWLGF